MFRLILILYMNANVKEIEMKLSSNLLDRNSD